MSGTTLDPDYLQRSLLALLEIPSPSGYTDTIVHFVGEELERLGVKFELTRRGAIRADLPGRQTSPDRALVAHLDTLGMMVRALKPNGRLAVAPIGTWSSRFAEGARVTLLADGNVHRGTVLPLMASGHAFGDEIDRQPVSWAQVELRVDQPAGSVADLERLGVRVGDFIAVDPQTEIVGDYVVSRHLDDKAGVAVLLAVAKAVTEGGERLPIECHLLFTIHEEVGSGASAVLHQDVAEMVAIDNAIPAPGQNSSEDGVTVAAMDLTGPFDYHLTRKLVEIGEGLGIPVRRDVFPHYRCDAASAVEAGNDIRTALLCFGLDGSHGYERARLSVLNQLAALVLRYTESPPAVARDRMELGPLDGFPDQPHADGDASD